MTLFFSRSLRFKLIFLSTVGLLPVILGLFLYVIPLFENYFLDAKKNEVHAAVDLVVAALKNLDDEVKSGKMPEADAKERGREIVRNLKYNTSDYIYAYNFEGRVQAHGMNRAMENTDRIDSKDGNGKPYVKEFVQLATGPGFGFVAYKFEKEKGGKPFDKVAYVRAFPQWKWIVGSGVYLDTVQDTILHLKIKIAVGIGLAVLSSLLFALLFSNRLNRQLLMISEGLRKEIEDFTTTAETLASASESLSASAAQQASALQQTSASVEETNSMISKNVDSAKQSKQISEVSQQHVTKGKEIVLEVSDSIKTIAKSNEDIAAQINQSNSEISDIIKVIYEISEKTKVINDIVFQTKLLSFNASVEAARAGENGKGFAVVADEVGKLAQMSGNSAKEITDLLEKSVQKVKQTAESSKTRIEILMVEGNKKIEIGLKKADNCNDTLDQIVESVQQVTVRVSEITSATDEQARGVNEISKAMVQLDAASQHTSSSSQETANAAEKLRQQVNTLRGIAGDLSNTVNGAPKQKAA